MHRAVSGINLLIHFDSCVLIKLRHIHLISHRFLIFIIITFAFSLKTHLF